MSEPTLQVTFLGTGTSQGVPVIACDCEVCRSLDFHDKRLRTSILIRAAGQTLVVDTGPDFRQQMLRESVTQLDAVLFTHAHKDHTAGLDDVRAFNFRQGADMPIYGTRNTHDQLRAEFHYAFEPNAYPGIPRLQLKEIDQKPFQVGPLKVTPLPVMHLNLPVLGFRIGSFSYITDANYISEETIALVKGSTVLVLNALQREKHVSHFNLEEAIAISRRMGVPLTYFTHMSHKMGLHGTVETEMPEGIRLAFDGLTISV